MFTVEAGTTVVTISELRRATKQTVEATHEGLPVVVIADGKPVGALVDMDSLNELLDIREAARLAAVAQQRMDRLESGEARLLEHGEFWSAAKANASARSKFRKKAGSISGKKARTGP